MSGPQKVAPGAIKPEDIVAQFGVVLTKDGNVAVHFPGNPDTGPDPARTLELIAAGLNTLANVLRQRQPQEQPRIVPVTHIPKEFLSRGKI